MTTCTAGWGGLGRLHHLGELQICLGGARLFVLTRGVS